MNDVDYYRECLAESLKEHGVSATPEQIDAIARDVAGAYENIGMAFGHDAIPNPEIAERKRVKANHDLELREAEERTNIWKLEACRIARVDPKDAYINHGEVYMW